MSRYESKEKPGEINKLEMHTFAFGGIRRRSLAIVSYHGTHRCTSRSYRKSYTSPFSGGSILTMRNYTEFKLQRKLSSNFFLFVHKFDWINKAFEKDRTLLIALMYLEKVIIQSARRVNNTTYPLVSLKQSGLGDASTLPARSLR